MTDIAKMDELVKLMATAIVNGDWDELPNLHKVLALSQARATLKAIQSSGKWVVVPREPSEEMVDRFVSRALQVSVHGEGGWSNYAREQYTAMIEANDPG